MFRSFLISFFLQQHKNAVKSNNKNNNYINQLLRLPLLKHTHTKNNNSNNNNNNNNYYYYYYYYYYNNDKGSSNLPSNGKSTPRTPQMEVPTAKVKE